MNTCLPENRITAWPGCEVSRADEDSTDTDRGGGQTWMISFADLMAILLTFMVVSFSTRQVDAGPWENMSQSMQSVFRGQALGEVRSSTDRFVSVRKNALEAGYVASLLGERFPELAGDGGLSLTPDGVEIDLAAVALDAEGMGDLVVLLSSIDNSLMIRSVSSLASDNATSIQRIVAWEKGIDGALGTRDELMSIGLAREPRISASVVAGGAEGSVLLIERSRGAGL